MGFGIIQIFSFDIFNKVSLTRRLQMITYSFDNIGNTTLYEHLYNCIKKDILTGNLKSGDALPSKRALSKQLDISIITIETSYEQLMSEGYIYSVPRKGYYVSELSDFTWLMQDSLISTLPSDKTQTLSSRPNIKCSASNSSDYEHPLIFCDFSNNQTTPESFPFSTWAKLTRKILVDEQSQLMTNPPAAGCVELRKAIAEYLKQFRRISVNYNQIVIGAGTEYLYGLLIQLLGFDKTYATENPGYKKTSMICNSYNVRHVSIPLDNNGIQIAPLNYNNVNIVHVTPSHHFPTGITMPVNRRYELLEWAASDKNKYIIEDDYDSEFRMLGRPVPSLFGMSTTGNVIYMNTFTKSLASTMRISYMVLPNALSEKFHQVMKFYSCTVPTFEQYTLAHYINEGYYEKHINRMRNSYKKKRNMLLHELYESPLASYSHISEENSGLHFLLSIKLNCSDSVFIKNALQNGIRINSLSEYITSASDENIPLYKDQHEIKGAFIINYSSIPDRIISDAVKKLYISCKPYLLV